MSPIRCKAVVTEYVKVTPDMCREWLKDRILTRRINISKVRRFADQMRKGNWELTHQGFAFNTDNELIDGQHRAAAVIAAGVTIMAAVTHGLSRECSLYIDASGGRTVSDSLSAYHGKHMNKAIANIINHMILSDMDGRPKVAPSPDIYDAFLKRHLKGINFAATQFHAKVRGLSQAPLKAAVAKAFYHIGNYADGMQRLEQFCEVMRSGMMMNLGTDKAAIVLRNHLLEGRFDKSGCQRKVIYLRVAYCLQKFLEGENIGQVKKIKQDPFPLSKPAADFVNYDETIDELLAEVVAEAEAVFAKPEA